MLLFFVRHGDPDYANDSLTPLGREQAEAVVVRMERCRPNRLRRQADPQAHQDQHHRQSRRAIPQLRRDRRERLRRHRS